ncbi:MAG TPA: hypothetical protein VFE77_03115 [Rhodanobacter sp.]|nr:hypothetical protein [Rhodanobacter sp.]
MKITIELSAAEEGDWARAIIDAIALRRVTIEHAYEAASRDTVAQQVVAAAPEQVVAAAPEPRETSRRRKANAISGEVAEAAPVDPTPPTTRHRNASTVASVPLVEAPAAAGATEPSPAPSAVSTSRRRAPATSAETPSIAATASPSEEITDADLAKAASAGARALTPRVVTELVAKFGVKTVGEMKGVQRRDFIDEVRRMIEATK